MEKIRTVMKNKVLIIINLMFSMILGLGISSIFFVKPKSEVVFVEKQVIDKDKEKLEKELIEQLEKQKEEEEKSKNEISKLQEKIKEVFMYKIKYFIKINEEKLVFEKLSDINTYKKIDFNGKTLIPFKLEGNILSYHEAEKGGFKTETSLNEKGQVETKILELWDTKNLDEILKEMAH